MICGWGFWLVFVCLFCFVFRRNPRQVLKPVWYSCLRHVKHLVLVEQDTDEANTPKRSKSEYFIPVCCYYAIPISVWIFNFHFWTKVLPPCESRSIRHAVLSAFICTFLGWDFLVKRYRTLWTDAVKASHFGFVLFSASSQFLQSGNASF